MLVFSNFRLDSPINPFTCDRSAPITVNRAVSSLGSHVGASNPPESSDRAMVPFNQSSWMASIFPNDFRIRPFIESAIIGPELLALS